MGHREGSGREAGAERIKPSPDDCFHLTLEIVREIHAEAIARFGGLNGVRDENLLASAASSAPRFLLSTLAFDSRISHALTLRATSTSLRPHGLRSTFLSSRRTPRRSKAKESSLGEGEMIAAAAIDTSSKEFIDLTERYATDAIRRRLFQELGQKPDQ